MIIVTGGAGFIGANIVKGLNDRGREDVIVFDNLQNGEKFLKEQLDSISQAIVFEGSG